MKKYMGVFTCNSVSDICVFADTKEEAGKIAFEHFISMIKKELKVHEMKARTERCDICQYTYIPSGMENGCVCIVTTINMIPGCVPRISRSSFSARSVTHYTAAGKLELNLNNRSNRLMETQTYFGGLHSRKRCVGRARFRFSSLHAPLSRAPIFYA